MSRALHLPTVCSLFLFVFLGSVSLCGCVGAQGEEARAQRVDVSAQVEARGAGFENDVRAVAAFLRHRSSGLTNSEIDRVAPVIVSEARRSGFSLQLVLAVIHVESGGNMFAESKAGALGLMQLLPATGQATAVEVGIQWQGTGTLFDPAENVRLGVAYLELMVDQFGDLPTALAAYNWGPTRISGFLRSGAGVPMVYAERVLRTAQYGV